MLSTQQIRWCAYLTRQIEGGPVDVSRICDSLDWIHSSLRSLDISDVRYLGGLIGADVSGWRESALETVNGVSVGSDPEKIEMHLTQLLEAWNAHRADPKYFYWEFEAIHPFARGASHAAGVLLYNWCNRSTGKPVFPPLYGTA